MRRFASLFGIMVILMLASGCSGDGSEVSEPTIEETQAVSSSAFETEETLELTSPPETTIETESHEKPAAEQISDGVHIFIGETEQTAQLSDEKHTTKKTVKDGQQLRVEAEEAFGAVYIEWDRIPGVYVISWQGGSREYGTENFLHDYIRLPESVSEITFTFEDGTNQSVCDIAVYTAGRAPDGVQDWQEPCETADILVFPTHADDDVFFFGPLIAYYAIERELTVQTAFMVDHERQPERANERLNGLWEMGLRHYPILGEAPDTGVGTLDFGLTYYADSDIYGWQMEQIRRFRPLVILGHDLDGEYGNKGHKVNAYYLTQTVVDAADPEKDPESAQKFGVWDTPKLYLHLYEENAWMFDVNVVMEKDPEGRTPLQVANKALDCHVSQNGVGMSVYQNEYAPEWDCRPFGLYRTLVGYDTKADVMENLDPGQWR